MTWTPGTGLSRSETATTVGFFHLPHCQISRNSSEEASPSQSITTRAVLPPVSSLKALDELRQRLVQIYRFRGIRLMVLNTCVFRQKTKNSNARPALISVLVKITSGEFLHRVQSLS